VWVSSAIYGEFTGIERIKEYCDYTKHEKSWNNPKAKEGWPKTGKMSLKGVTVRYREGLPLVLNGVSFDVNSGEKVGVVGRTGSGKSTLLLALMRVLEMDDQLLKSGKAIEIDGVRIDKIGLHELRRNLCIIPQDPFLMEGTLRSNVDPFGLYDTTEIIRSLKIVDFFQTLIEDDQSLITQTDYNDTNHSLLSGALHDSIVPSSEASLLTDTSKNPLALQPLKTRKNTPLENLLDFKIEARGANLSLGQRQLICIARALVKQPKILLMDEATANIDQKTDQIIQKVIHQDLYQTTVITIAHRINTIIEYDKIVVLKDGEVVEEGHPFELLSKSGEGECMFKGMVEAGGAQFFNSMLSLAEESHKTYKQKIC
jgi:ABC-type multidrug transport system fused ATPase/permease subunit